MFLGYGVGLPERFGVKYINSFTVLAFKPLSKHLCDNGSFIFFLFEGLIVMDYQVFMVQQNGNISHLGTVQNAKSFQDAKARLKAKFPQKGGKFYLVKSDNFIKVNI